MLFNFFIYSVLLVQVLSSCSSHKQNFDCENFNFKRLPFDKSYFLGSLFYTNGIDTIELKNIYQESSVKNVAGNAGIYVEECKPYFFYMHENNNKSLQLSNSFSYYPYEENFLKMKISVCFSEIEINIDSLKLNKITTIKLSEKNNLSASLKKSEIIRRIDLYNLKVIYFEKFSGENWKLIYY
jgi:hypothetical protein